MKALLVDDSATMRKIQKGALETLGFDAFVEAGDGVEAIQKMREGNFAFDLIVIDWNMPNMDGLTFVQKIRSVPALKGLKVVMVTSNADRPSIVAALKAGVNGYVAKPFTPDTFKQKVKEILGGPNGQGAASNV
ncbi:MAG: response regulator [Nitrospirae bacterium]|nr:response regulator [Nitrospirota bacterium]